MEKTFIIFSQNFVVVVERRQCLTVRFSDIFPLIHNIHIWNHNTSYPKGSLVVTKETELKMTLTVIKINRYSNILTKMILNNLYLDHFSFVSNFYLVY